MSEFHSEAFRKFMTDTWEITPKPSPSEPQKYRPKVLARISLAFANKGNDLNAAPVSQVAPEQSVINSRGSLN